MISKAILFTAELMNMKNMKMRFTSWKKEDYCSNVIAKTRNAARNKS